MLIPFFYALREAGLPVSLKEFLSLLAALQQRLAFGEPEAFYYLARTVLIKDEKYFDRFDQVFAQFFHGMAQGLEDLEQAIPEEWLKKQVEKFLSEAEQQQLAAMGWEELMQTLQQRLAEQQERHQGGNKWVGTGGTSPFGAFGYNPAGVRIGQPASRHRRAVKVWDKREFRNFDDQVELGTRNIKVALRRLREFAREGAEEVLNLDATIAATAHNAGLLSLQMERELHNSVKLLVLFDVGGSMDEHIRACEELFSAVKSEFKHLEYFYFHNCPYEALWKDNQRRHTQHFSTWNLLHTFSSDYKLILVGDASMSPYEILYPGGSVEHMNEESGEVWLKRLLGHFKHTVWLNPMPEERWRYSQSLQLIQQYCQQRMYPLTIAGIDQAMRALKRGMVSP